MLGKSIKGRTCLTQYLQNIVRQTKPFQRIHRRQDSDKNVAQQSDAVGLLSHCLALRG